MYRLLLQGILYAIRNSVPAEGPDIVTSRDLSRPHKWWSTIEPTFTQYGYPVDYESLLTRAIDFLLGRIPVTDEEPLFTLSEHLEDRPLWLPVDHEYLHRIPEEATRPQSLEEFLLEGTGAFFLRRSDNLFDDFVVDLSHYERYAVRPGLYRYGGKAHLRDGKIHHYDYLGTRYDGDDPLMQQIFRASLCFELLAGTHALRLHLCTAQRKTLELRNRFGVDHPLIDLLYILTFGVLDINRKISLLVAPHGLVSRIFGFTPEAFAEIVNDALATRAISKTEAVGLRGTVWNSKLVAYYEHVETLLSDLFAEEGIKDTDLHAELADFFVASTALHNQVGDAQIHSMTTSGFLLPKVYRDAPGKISAQDFSLMQTLLVAVSPRYPLLVDEALPSVFQREKHATFWKRFADGLRESYADESWFQPLFFETSIGF